MKTYQIRATFDVYKDNYNEGEGEHVNSWHNSASIAAENPIAAIKQFFEKELYFSFDEKLAHVDDLNGENVLLYSHCVGEENEEISVESQAFEDFKAGKRELYTAHSRLEVFELVPVNLPNIN